jgi:hypothetical protein
MFCDVMKIRGEGMWGGGGDRWIWISRIFSAIFNTRKILRKILSEAHQFVS